MIRFTEEHNDIREMVSSFADNELAPRAEHVDAVHSVVPAVVRREIEGDEVQRSVEIDVAIDVGRNRFPYLATTFESSHRATHGVTGIEEPEHGVFGDVSASAGDQCSGHS